MRDVTSVAPGRPGAAPGGLSTRGWLSARGWLIPLGLFGVALVLRLAVASQVPFPTTETSAYYVGVARNIVAGQGLMSDAVWSYATPPLTAPKPAFELWLPMSSFLSAIAMSVLGSTFAAAQVGSALLGSLLAPLTWAVAREAAWAQGLDERRSLAVSLAAGLIAAVLAPFVLSAAVPDSFASYVVFSVAAALLAPRVLGVRDQADGAPLARPSLVAGIVLGALMGLAYLSRQEAVWLGLAVILALGLVLRRRPAGRRIREASIRLAPVVAGGLIVVLPWLYRNAMAFGSPFPGQALENAVLRRNEDIYAFLDRPNLAAYLGQGAATVLGNPIAAAWDNLLNVVIIPAFPIGVAGLLAAVALRRSPALRWPTALSILLLSGGLTALSTVLLFPVATRWGTFLHASGPLLVALVVTATLGGDALLARISALRHWERPNVILAPTALLAVAVGFGLFQAGIVARQGVALQDRYARLAESLAGAADRLGEKMPQTLMTDHPVWLAHTLGRPTIALPDEPLSSITRLAQTFGAPWLVVMDGRGRYPDALLEGPDRDCIEHDPIALTEDTETAWLFILEPQCQPASAGASP